MNDAGNLLSLDGKLVLVTGGSGGIGRAVVEHLGAAGARVLSVDLEGREPPPGAEAITCDLGDAQATRALGARLTRQHPVLDALVHCAGITRDSTLARTSPTDWDLVLRVNLDSAFVLLQSLLPSLREAEAGSVVLLSSINAERGKFGQTSYAASKAGLLGFGKSAARELGRHGIRVNSIAPGWIETPMTANLPDEFRRRALEETALGRLGTPADVAHVVLFLCSELSRHVTGQVLRVDGGQLTA